MKKTIKQNAGFFDDSWSSAIECKILTVAINFMSMIALDDGCVKMRPSSINHPNEFNNLAVRFGARNFFYRN